MSGRNKDPEMKLMDLFYLVSVRFVRNLSGRRIEESP